MEKHPDDEIIETFIYNKLEDEEDIEAGTHIANCKKCLKKARLFSKLEDIWESLNMESYLKVLKKVDGKIEIKNKVVQQEPTQSEPEQ